MASQVVSAVGAFTAAGYVGWVAGAPIVGWVSQNLGPARGLQVLASGLLGVAACTLLSPDAQGRHGGQRVSLGLDRHDPAKASRRQPTQGALNDEQLRRTVPRRSGRSSSTP